MKRQIAFFLILVITTIFACKKENASANLSLGQVKAVQVIDSFFGSGTYVSASNFSTYYSYDIQGRIVQASTYGVNGNFWHKIKYVHVIDTVYQYLYYNTFDSLTPSIGAGILNQQGYLISGQVDNDISKIRSYDVNGYLVYDSSYTWGSNEYTVTNGNIITDLVKNQFTQTYAYLPNIEYRNFGKSYLGKTNSNLVSSIVLLPTGAVINYSYQFDNIGRVVKEIMTMGTSEHKISSFSYFN